ncbi:MAG TPA: DUF4430 domain-containing protein [Syntrophomonas sp.]|nr:DUF4430 domain-containing protein [Syntrophomonas sp.]
MQPNNRNKIFMIGAMLVLLTLAFFWGGSPGGEEEIRGLQSPTAVTGSENGANANAPLKASLSTPQLEEKTSAASETGKAPTAAKQELLPPKEPNENKVVSSAETCTLSVQSTTILDNLDKFDESKRQVLPPDGIIFPTARVSFNQGESVFNVLQREMKQAGIHLEFTSVPVYNANYIEGIGNIYELDCGELSGWVYKVNGQVPNYGCSRYQLQDGDIVEFVYTCNLGRDVGGYNFREE